MLALVAGVAAGALAAPGNAPADSGQQASSVLVTVMVGDRPVRYTQADLALMPQHRIFTKTVVTDGVQMFEGPLMRDLLAHAGLQADEIEALALNDYYADIPTADFTRYDVIAAIRRNGDFLTVRDKGPVWVIYPRDAHRELQDILYDMRSVWQLVRIEAR